MSCICDRLRNVRSSPPYPSNKSHKVWIGLTASKLLPPGVPTEWLELINITPPLCHSDWFRNGHPGNWGLSQLVHSILLVRRLVKDWARELR